MNRSHHGSGQQYAPPPAVPNYPSRSVFPPLASSARGGVPNQPPPAIPFAQQASLISALASATAGLTSLNPAAPVFTPASLPPSSAPTVLKVPGRPNEGPEGTLQDLAWSSTSTAKDAYLATCSVRGVIRVLRIGDQATVREVCYLFPNNARASPASCVAWDPVNPNVRLASFGEDRLLRVWDAQRSLELSSVDAGGVALDISWSPCGRYIATTTHDNLVSVVDVRKPNAVMKSKTFAYEINDATWFPSTSVSRLVLATGRNGRGHIEVLSHDLSSPLSSGAEAEGDQACAIRAHVSSCMRVTMSPNGGRMATSSKDDGLVSLWSTQELTCTGSMKRMDHPIECLSFTGDGKHLASSSKKDDYIAVCDAERPERPGWRVPIRDVSDVVCAFLPSAASRTLVYAGKESNPTQTGCLRIVLDASKDA